MAEGGSSGDVVEVAEEVEMKTSSESSHSNTKRVKGMTVEQTCQSLLKLLPEHEDFVRENIIKPLCPSEEDYRQVGRLLLENLQRGLDKETHDTADVKMYTSYVREVPDGTENGKFVALDFEGPNFRVMTTTIENGQATADNKYFHIPSRILDSTGIELFDYIAKCVRSFLQSRNLLSTPTPLPLGFTFWFPFKQTALNHALLKTWTKGFHCEGVVGLDVGRLLQEALDRAEGVNVAVDAIVNDTVGTLLSGALGDPKCAIGLILAKGTNACYLESLSNVGTWEGPIDDPPQVIVNTEWHSLGKDGCLDFFRSEYDVEVDEHSRHKGDARYEKMISGMFLGEIVRLVLKKLADNNVLYHDHWSDEVDTRGHFYTKYVSEVLDDETVRFKYTRHVFDDLGMHHTSETECKVLHHICLLASIRAIRLVSIGLATLLNKMNRPEVGIAVDGSLYRFHPLFHDLMTETIPLYLNPGIEFRFVPAADGSGMGAAIAAAVAERRLHASKMQ